MARSSRCRVCNCSTSLHNTLRQLQQESLSVMCEATVLVTTDEPFHVLYYPCTETAVRLQDAGFYLGNLAEALIHALLVVGHASR